MPDKKNAPEIRFKGFLGPWKKSKLGNYVLIQRGGSPRPIEQYITTDIKGINWIKIGDVTKNSRYITNTKEKIIPDGVQFSRKVYAGDLILSNSMSFGRPYILKIDGCIHDGWLLIRNEKNIFNIEYLFQALSSDSMILQYKALASGGVVNNLNSELVQSTNIDIPPMEEQEKIGKFFSKIDDLIKFEKQKIDKLQNVKKSMLDKMFPKNGNTVPAIRFKGFLEPWEENKLKHLCKVFTDGDWIETKDQSVFGVRLIQTGNIGINEFIDKSEKSKWISYETYQRLKCKAVLPEDILISRLPEPAGRACIVPNINHKMITAVDCTILRLLEEYNNKFVVQFLSTDNYFKKVNNFLAGGTRQRISRSTLGDFKIILPKNRLEEQQIGKFFSKIDDLIKLQQQKLEKFKNIKKSMLDKMFV